MTIKTVINSTPNADISKMYQKIFFLIKLKILYIWALKFPHMYFIILRKV